MNWYKKALKLDSLKDRSLLNDRIRKMQDMVVTLDYLKKYIYQNAGGARTEIQKLIGSKTLSSFPSIVELLRKADEKALDNYDTFADFCEQALQKLYAEIKSMESTRKRFVNHVLPAKMKKRKEQYQKDRDERKQEEKKTKEGNE